MNNKWRLQLPLHLMIIPGLLLVLIFSYGPMLGIIIAFQKFTPTKGIFGSPLIGFDNFIYVFKLPSFYRVIWNTIFIACMKIIAGLVVPLTVAILLNEIRKEFFKRAVQTLVYLPHFLSWVILSGVLMDILSPSTGIVNQGLQWLGIKQIFFMADNHWFPFTLVLSNEWKEFGFGSIIYLAAITSINPSLYEASVIDGANRWKQTWHVTLPGMTPIIVLMVTLSIGNVLNAGFEQVFNLYSPVVYQSGDIIDTFVYRIGIVDAQYGVATAIGLFKSVVSFLLLSSSYLLAYRFANYRVF
ncbi:sugar ABC transporter permease [Paenibacillus baekrokdamisoli]|uniref:Sugar ABC transporter permease n=1 Tax=Paenibacillus baekrokdamisoli TaxID=1712516 RepID=A0A3G9JND6_9BACL|nr:ABC transporter permease subunit [Paenibacillus baekrokdamisoli]MBB3071418.1 putative aldouronate transport system permease protein [Paenibacillus baekrokdamisoli]BBH24549.1 sugar ABC transporter permease [Paenibacillus baekrokdamisoli]